MSLSFIDIASLPLILTVVFFHDGSTKIVIDCRTNIFAGQFNSKSETCSSWNDDIIITYIWKSHKQVLVDSAGVVSDCYALSNSFDA